MEWRAQLSVVEDMMEVCDIDIYVYIKVSTFLRGRSVASVMPGSFFLVVFK